jgi:hypothetical protein
VTSGLPHGAVSFVTAIAAYPGVVIASGVVGKLAGIVIGTLRRGAH